MRPDERTTRVIVVAVATLTVLSAVPTGALGPTEDDERRE